MEGAPESREKGVDDSSLMHGHEACMGCVWGFVQMGALS